MGFEMYQLAYSQSFSVSPILFYESVLLWHVLQSELETFGLDSGG